MTPIFETDSSHSSSLALADALIIQPEDDPGIAARRDRRSDPARLGLSGSGADRLGGFERSLNEGIAAGEEIEIG